MQNINYDLVKLMHAHMDTVWRLEKHYLNDAKEAKCHSVAALTKILEAEKAHIEMLRDEIRMRMEAGKFN